MLNGDGTGNGAARYRQGRVFWIWHLQPTPQATDQDPVGDAQRTPYAGETIGEPRERGRLPYEQSAVARRWTVVDDLL